ncbi:MAG: DUF995 domain-containing protein [Rhizobiales bacterium]|nr:DUF995 domain-containing protein [Hyphomicrobiales bacterium]
MMFTRSTIAGAMVSVLLLAGGAAAAQKPSVSQLAMAATPMKASAVRSLYAGRTWKWSTGGGYFSTRKGAPYMFSPDQNKFVAATQKGGTWSYAEGVWGTTADGRMCMTARWTTANFPTSSPAFTCFLHREKNGVIYQKRALGGDWYVFRHNPPQAGDEAAKLVSGDLVSKDVARRKSGR